MKSHAEQEHTPGQSRSPAMLGRPHQTAARHAPVRRQCYTSPTALRPSTTGSDMGLGLVIVAELTTLLGGCYGVESQVGAGNRFSIQLLSTNPFLTDLASASMCRESVTPPAWKIVPQSSV